MKRGEFSETEKNLMHRAEREHELFMYRMLSKSRKTIYQKCNEIRFVECVYEYLIYAENIAAEKMKALLNCQEDVFMELYRVYLENEYTRVETWEDVENLIDVMISEQQGQNELQSTMN